MSMSIVESAASSTALQSYPTTSMSQQQSTFEHDPTEEHCSDNSSSSSDNNTPLISCMSSFLSLRRQRQRQQPSQYHVRFSSDVLVTDIDTISEYTDDQIEAMYYQPHEYHEIKQSMLDIIHAINEGFPPRRLSSRGLEHLTKDGRIKFRGRIDESIDLVYDLQVLQLEEEQCHPMDDDSIIPTEYADFCFQSSVDAYLRGKEDEMAARKIAKSSTSSSVHRISPPRQMSSETLYRRHNVITT